MHLYSGVVLEPPTHPKYQSLRKNHEVNTRSPWTPVISQAGRSEITLEAYSSQIPLIRTNATGLSMGPSRSRPIGLYQMLIPEMMPRRIWSWSKKYSTTVCREMSEAIQSQADSYRRYHRVTWSLSGTYTRDRSWWWKGRKGYVRTREPGQIF